MNLNRGLDFIDASGNRISGVQLLLEGATYRTGACIAIADLKNLVCTRIIAIDGIDVDKFISNASNLLKATKPAIF